MTVRQLDFTQAILDPNIQTPAGLVNPDGVPATKRFNVYRNNVAVSLSDALATAFPVVEKLVGTENFKKIASIYVRKHPPSSPLMMFYGAEMPGFLASFEPLQHVPYLPDVAKLELALRHAYHAADVVGVPAETFQDMPIDRLMQSRMKMAPAVHLVRSRFPIQAIWRFNMEPGSPKPEAVGQNVLVTRPDLDPIQSALPPGGGVFVSSLIQGKTFGEAVDATTAQVPDFDLTACFGILIAGSAITKLNEDE